MPRWTCASVPAKISAIPAARQTIVSFSDVKRSTMFFSVFVIFGRDGTPCRPLGWRRAAAECRPYRPMRERTAILRDGKPNRPESDSGEYNRLFLRSSHRGAVGDQRNHAAMLFHDAWPGTFSTP